MIIKPLASEIALSGTATDVGLASVVRVINTGTTAAGLVTILNGVTTVATVTLAANESAIIEKDPTETLTGAATLRAVKVAYTN
jgi:hypothetical protein